MASASPAPPFAITNRSRYWVESVIRFALFGCACVSVLTTFGIVGILAKETVEFFLEVSPAEYFTGTRWTPQFEPAHFGVLPLISGTVLVALGAAVFALPLGLMSAVYLSEYASTRTRTIVKPVLEILAGVPSVVYGYFAVIVISPILRWAFPSADVFNAASASIVVAIMVMPMVISLSEDVLRSVPSSLREGAYALGATKLDVTVGVVVPAALSGIMASFLLAISRAIGETMAVALAAGATPRLTLNPLRSIQTMTAYIVQVSQGDTPTGSIEYKTIFAVGMTLFCLTLPLCVLGQWILSKFREVYD